MPPAAATRPGPRRRGGARRRAPRGGAHAARGGREAGAERKVRVAAVAEAAGPQAAQGTREAEDEEGRGRGGEARPGHGGAGGRPDHARGGARGRRPAGGRVSGGSVTTTPGAEVTVAKIRNKRSSGPRRRPSRKPAPPAAPRDTGPGLAPPAGRGGGGRWGQ